MNLKLTLEKAQEAYKKATNDQKALLIDLYGAQYFLTDVKDLLKGYASACVLLQRDQLTLLDYSKGRSDKQAKREFARHKISTCIEAINEGWYPDFDNTNQPKYYIWMYGKKSGFSSSVSYYYDNSEVCSDLYCETREKAELIEKICREDYIEYLF